MVRAGPSAVVLASLLALPAAPDGPRGPELTGETFPKWRDYLLPKGEDLAYRVIPWRASFWEAVVEAQAQEKPILLWAMNGHPLCNT